MSKTVKTIKTLADLTPDSMNPNKGTERGRQLVDQSLTAYGFGRSILVDRSANVIAGNKTLEAAINHDLPVRVIQTDGKEVIAVQRTDIDLFSIDDHERQTARGLSIVDNEATQQADETVWTDLVLILQTAVLRGISQSRMTVEEAFADGVALSAELKASLSAKLGG